MGRIVRVTGALATAAMLALLPARSGALAAPAIVPPLPGATEASQTITTLLGEVGRGAVGGREFLTLQVALPVGPPGCRGHVLWVDTFELGDAERRDRIETAALSAMLGDQVVAVTVPLDEARCIDGKPTFSDVRPLPPGR